jgi:hypothetical protein
MSLIKKRTCSTKYDFLKLRKPFFTPFLLLNCQTWVNIFEHYCQHNQEPISRAMFEQSLFAKRQHIDFTNDMTLLLAGNIPWRFEYALEQVEKQLITRIRGKPWGNPKRKGFQDVS